MNSTTRLAPSPTGALHLGNARTFLVNWLLARQKGWKIRLRIEDLDGPRIKRGADKQLIDDLRWIGLDWDDEPVYQSDRLNVYRDSVQQLVFGRMAYPCVCSRREVELAASAPHAEDGAAIYPGTCKDKYNSVESAQHPGGRAPAIRFRVGDDPIEFLDCFEGPQRFHPQQQLGDFVIAKADGTPAYQLAVVVDDAEMGVTHVVRGDDLLDSTPRQMLLYRALGLDQAIPTYCHLPLIVGTDGRRLAKRHGDTRLAAYRELGVKPGRLIAMLARWCGVEDAPAIVSPRELLDTFRLENLPKKPIIFRPEDHAWLLSDHR
jgi:glutamyl-tRNA synthetase